MNDSATQATAGGRVHSGERRRCPRYRVRHEVFLSWAEGENRHRERTFTMSISQFGCSVYSFRALRPGTRVTIERQGESREGKVAYALVDHSTKRVEIGIGFDLDASPMWGDVEVAEI
jgi:PilZ domain.